MALREENISYQNALARFVDIHTIEATDHKGQRQLHRFPHILIATGGRPKYPDIPGAEWMISSDDLFQLKQSPGRTLIVGASYVALECAGFLAGLNFDVSVMARSVFLRGFDQKMAKLVVQYMENHQVRFLKECLPVSIEKTLQGKFKVTWKNQENKQFHVKQVMFNH